MIRPWDRSAMILVLLVIAIAMFFPDEIGRAYAVLQGILPMVVIWLIWKNATLERRLQALEAHDRPELRETRLQTE